MYSFQRKSFLWVVMLLWKRFIRIDGTDSAAWLMWHIKIDLPPVVLMRFIQWKTYAFPQLNTRQHVLRTSPINCTPTFFLYFPFILNECEEGEWIAVPKKSKHKKLTKTHWLASDVMINTNQMANHSINATANQMASHSHSIAVY